jgi:hypothetical protein
MLSYGLSKINNYNTYTSSDSGYTSDISECSFYNYKNIDLFNTKTFNYHVKQILEIYFVFNKHYRNYLIIITVMLLFLEKILNKILMMEST